MRITRSGSRRWRGTKVVVDGKPSEINDLEIKFNKVPDLNSSRTHHDHTVRISDEELDQLLDERLKRFIEIFAPALNLQTTNAFENCSTNTPTGMRRPAARAQRGRRRERRVRRSRGRSSGLAVVTSCVPTTRTWAV